MRIKTNSEIGNRSEIGQKFGETGVHSIQLEET